MPLFFSEEKKISIKTDCTSIVNGSSPVVVPAEDLQHDHISNPNSNPDGEQYNAMTGYGEDSTTPAEVVPSRKKKPINWELIGATVWVILPMTLLLFRMSTDGFTREFVLGRMYSFLDEDAIAIAYYSNALHAKQDSKALEARADCYSKLGLLENERTDLRALVKSIDVTKKQSWQTYRHYPRLAALESRLGDVDSAIKIYRLYSTFSSDGGNTNTHYAKDAAYKLLLLGDISKSKELLAKLEQAEQGKKTDPMSNLLEGRREGYTQLLKALIYREEGDKVSALDTAKSIDDRYSYAFRDSRWKSSSKEEVARWTLEALIYLDDRNTDKARPLIKMAESELSGSDKSEPILDVVKAWLLLEEGRLDECLQLTATTLAKDKEEEKEDESIIAQNLKAAAHLIRKNVFLKQNLSEQASREDELYKQMHVSGRIFTPICFRNSP